MSVLRTEPCHVFQLTVAAEEEEGEDEEEEKGQLSVTLKFTYTPTYPEEAPIFEVIFDDDDLAQDFEQEIRDLVLAQLFFQNAALDTSDMDLLDEGQLSVTLKFTYTPTYPEEAPIFEVIFDDDDLAQDFEQEIRDLVLAQIEENLGMAMIFAIVSASQEFLNERIDDIKAAKEDRKNRIEEEKKRVEEEAANKLKGTLVTIESFLEWKDMFDKEQKGLRGKRQSASENTSGKLTGKELFFQNAALDTSDMDLLDEGDRVEVDESLFQDLDLELDIDLDDED
eukprot:XP_011676623.1 PREDICTED: RWD domain-containing protein 1 [Strongylocentrotus purpuratus]